MIAFFMDIKSDDDREKVIRLYANYKNLMYSEANNILKDHHLAEDAVHDSFVKVIKYLHKIDESNVPRTRNYLVIICRNTAKDILRKTLPLNNDENTSDEISFEEAGRKSDTLDIVLHKESVRELAKAIEDLPEIYRDVFILRRVEGHSREEIAQILNISVEAVKKRLTRAKQIIIRHMNRREIV